ncbi:MAG: UPF0175 family protein [Chloroflexota bacterium]
MSEVSVRMSLPDDLVALLGTTQESAAAARQAVVLELLRHGRISQGRAAAVLGLSRYALLDLMAEHDVPSGALTGDEYEQDLAAADALVPRRRP